ncbi:MAG: hypothetical protein ACOYL3_27065 [Desulfuromonadaceae bacterium]
MEQNCGENTKFLFNTDDFLLKPLHIFTPPPVTPAAFLSKPVKLSRISPVAAHGMRPLLDSASHLFSIISLSSLSGLPALSVVRMKLKVGGFGRDGVRLLALLFRFDTGGAAFLRFKCGG